ncbi:RIO1 family-domain-containing protein [Achaetomium macrosporum]|uniref:Serine/threonine-protein kinase RIO1 n=1 Tax=Achaetomium macrosporum TaxID=79813 RepID=A0AAN7C2L1_9PEZI|nr:RIO1 family-domain-containing protein [Achaetomium macrosporum]
MSNLEPTEPDAQSQTDLRGADNNDVDLDDEPLDIFDSADELDDELLDNPSSDLIKSFNRQRQLHGHEASTPGAASVPRSNAQKPTANTRARIDDQIAELSKHASKIRLDNVKQDQERDKDKADRATAELVLDQRTRMILLQMINRGVISEVHGAISTGKEANVYGAVLFSDTTNETQHRAIKIYKTSILVFKDRERYITGEHRFKAGVDKGNNRKMVKIWAEKEFRNLRRLHAAGIPCPTPLVLKMNVLVMGFLGDKRGYAFPRLHNVRIEGDDADNQWRSLYIQLLGIMRRLFQVCNLVHADLSEYNILYNKGTLYIIDVSQSVEDNHPRSLEFLRMDIKNVGDFFRRQGVDTLQDRTVFNFITAREGPTEEPELSQAIERIYEARPAVADTDEALAAIEVDNEVFRNQFIPQSLEELYDIEREANEPVEKKVYKHLLAEHVADNKPDDKQEEGEDAASSDEDTEDGGAALSGSEEDNEEVDQRIFEKGRPRGRRHQPKEEKKAHKQSVKEEKREKRKDKMPKGLKKRLVANTARKKK